MLEIFLKAPSRTQSPEKEGQSCCGTRWLLEMDPSLAPGTWTWIVIGALLEEEVSLAAFLTLLLIILFNFRRLLYEWCLWFKPMSRKTEIFIGNIISEGHSWHRYAHTEFFQLATLVMNFHGIWLDSFLFSYIRKHFKQRFL